MNPLEQARTLYYEALECLKDGRAELAEKKLLDALALVGEQPQRALILTHLSGLMIEQGRFQEARKYCETVVQVGEANELTWMHLGLCHLGHSEHDKALECLGRALTINPEFADAHLNRGNVLEDLKQIEHALGSYDKAIALNPDFVDAHYNRAGLLQQNPARLNEALASYDRALALDPGFAKAHNNRGLTLEKLGRYEEALAGYDRAIALAPDLAEAHNNRGLAVHVFERLDEALASFDRAIQLRPDYADAYSNRGEVLKDLHRLDDAIDSYDKAIALKPYFPVVHLNKAHALLAKGDFGNGWREYEWRWKNASLQRHHGFEQDPWLGNHDISGKTILIHDEQGLGDTIHFCRYVEKVAALRAKVVLRVQAPLLSLLTGLRGAQQVVADDVPQFDCHCPLLSLPLAFQTRIDTIPRAVPYVHARPDAIEKWQELLRGFDGPKIGLVWAGSARVDRWQVLPLTGIGSAVVRTLSTRRSIPLAKLVPWLGLEASFISLQKEMRDSDRNVLTETPQIRDYSQQLGDFADTAALIANLDLVISVDTSVAHLAGAMGKPVWILLSSSADFRWLLGRTDSPWYPTARLFRQPRLGDWDSVIEEVKAALVAILKNEFRRSGAH